MTRIFRILVILSIVLAFTPSVPVSAATPFLVNTTDDTNDGVCDGTHCSLREAMEAANSTASHDTIEFNIPGSPPYTIQPASPLPEIVAPVTIDGTSQPGFAGSPIIELDGSNAGDYANGLTITAGDSIVKGLVINRFSANGIQIATNGGNVIQGNFIGTDVTGTLSFGNGAGGVNVGDSPANVIGGTTDQARNVITGNNGWVNVLLDGNGSTGNLVEGNFIGTDVTGTTALSNASNGVVIENGASNNTIGGLTPRMGNRVSGNSLGIWLHGPTTGNVVQGNFIGTDVDGTFSVPNSQGVTVDNGATDNVIGGTQLGACNFISGNTGNGIYIANPGTSRNVVQGNYIGTDTTGLVSLGNLYNGIALDDGASENVIGGSAPRMGNIISGNGFGGISISNAATANTVQGNFIGTDMTGTSMLPNGGGVTLYQGAIGNTIGGPANGARNVVSGNLGSGIFIGDVETTGNLVQGNFIGTDVTGSAELGNATNGVDINNAPGNSIGGTGVGAGNVISNNKWEGVVIHGGEAVANLVQGNFIGTDITGTAPRGNSGTGIHIYDGATNNTIGGTTDQARNVISSNSGHGVYIGDPGTSHNTLEGNYIGTDTTGLVDLGNAYNGIDVEDSASNNTIGGYAPGMRNLISGNGERGIEISGADTTGNAILANAIFGNAGLGIDLGADGVTPNDRFDRDTGPNNLQNFPVLSKVKTKKNSTTVEGSLASARRTTFRIEFFSNNTCDPSGYGEGRTFLGSLDVTTDLGGEASFMFTLPLSLPAGYFVTATATDPGNNTSEFSACRPASGGPTDRD
jgi:CSLREA domain-containing protein